MHIPIDWRLKKERYSLVGSECPFCGTKHFPPREICNASRNGKEGAPQSTEIGRDEVPAGQTVEAASIPIEVGEVLAVAVTALV